MFLLYIYFILIIREIVYWLKIMAWVPLASPDLFQISQSGICDGDDSVDLSGNRTWEPLSGVGKTWPG